MFSSLRRQLLMVWLLMLLICLALGALLYGLYGQTEGVKITEARSQLLDTCERIALRYNGASEAARSPSNVAGLREVVLQLVLAESNGVEGGIWSRPGGFVAYAYPTYQGSGTKSDIPQAERGNIETAARESVAANKPTLYVRSSNREVLLLAACPLDASTSAWTMTRVSAVNAGSFGRLLAGMSLLLGTVIVSAIGVGWALRRWNRNMSRVENALATADTSGIPTMPVTGSKELDRLGMAVTGYATRLSEARANADQLTAQLARHDRLVSLGRMIATVAHEIRNPIATMRLTAENAIADAGPNGVADLDALLAQVQRLDGVVESLLGMVQPIRLHVRDVVIEPWIRAVAAQAEAESDRAAILLRSSGDPAMVWPLDPGQLARAVDNLLRNAAQHCTPGTSITVTLAKVELVLRIDVANDGLPVAAEVRDQLFEPFVSGRTDGNGLGLALTREIAQAHGGSVRYEHADGVTHFTLELPWRAS